MVDAERVAHMTEEEFQANMRDLVKREFGLSGLVRYLASLPGEGDYTAERQSKPQPSFDEIIRDLEIFQGSPLKEAIGPLTR